MQQQSRYHVVEGGYGLGEEFRRREPGVAGKERTRGGEGRESEAVSSQGTVTFSFSIE